jgi:hypothetical protein
MKTEGNRKIALSFGSFSIYPRVFSNWVYLVIAAASAIGFWILFNLFDQLLFFSPIIIFYLPPDAVTGFIISTINSILLGVVISLNVYIMKNSRFKLSKSLISGSSLGVISSTCASCSSIGFLLSSTFGGSGVLLSSFLSVYQIPLRVLSLALLLFALYFAQKKISQTCEIRT